MIDIVGKRFWYLGISGVLVLICVISLATLGLKPGVEFSSGSVMTIGFEQQVEKAQLEQAMAGLGYPHVIVQGVGEGDFLLRLPEISSEQKSELEDGLRDQLGNLEVKEFDTISPIIAGETTRNAAIAVVVSSIGILLYIAWAFRRLPNAFRYGACAIIALLHDALMALGAFAILGAISGWEIDLSFVIAILAVIGYSVNDTVVIFDRIRENAARDTRSDFAVVVNNSLVETLGRSLNTVLTTLFVIIALLLFVGGPIRNFAVVLLVGIASGSYSSIGIAPLLLVVWRKGEWGRFVGRRPASVGEAGGR